MRDSRTYIRDNVITCFLKSILVRVREVIWKWEPSLSPSGPPHRAAAVLAFFMLTCWYPSPLTCGDFLGGWEGNCVSCPVSPQPLFWDHQTRGSVCVFSLSRFINEELSWNHLLTSPRLQKAEGGQGQCSLLSAAGFSQQSSDFYNFRLPAVPFGFCLNIPPYTLVTFDLIYSRVILLLTIRVCRRQRTHNTRGNWQCRWLSHIYICNVSYI